MKNIRNAGITLAMAAALFSCESTTHDNETAMTDSTELMAKDMKMTEEGFSYYGDTVLTEGAFSLDELEKDLTKDGKTAVKVTATIDEVCQKKGCWMNVNLPSGNPMRVKFKDYAFFVPMDASGSEVVMQGIAYYDTVTVEDQRHYAEDAGKPKEEIEMIKEPKFVLAFEADAVAIKERN